MTLQIVRMERKVFYATAVQVTSENIVEVAEWCGGEVRTLSEPAAQTQYVRLVTYKTTPERQARAYVGDWVMYAGRGYKSYTQKALDLTFKPAVEQAPLQEVFSD